MDRVIVLLVMGYVLVRFRKVVSKLLYCFIYINVNLRKTTTDFLNSNNQLSSGKLTCSKKQKVVRLLYS